MVPVVVEEWLEDWDYDFSSNSDYLVDVELAKWKTVLQECHEKNKGRLKDLRVCTKPYSEQGVAAKKNMEEGTIKLVPVTTQVSSSKKTIDPIPGQAVSLASLDLPDKTTAYIYASPYKQLADHGEASSSGHAQKAKADQFISPFWFVGTTPNPNDANCRVSEMNHKESKVTIIENVKKIKKDERLLIFVPDGAKKKYVVHKHSH